MSSVTPSHSARSNQYHHAGKASRGRKADRKAADIAQKIKKQQEDRVARQKPFQAQPLERLALEDLQLQVAVIAPLLARYVY